MGGEASVDLQSELENSDLSQDVEYQLIKKGIVKKNPDYQPDLWSSKPFAIDFNGAENILKSHKSPDKPPMLFNEERINAESGKCFKEAVKAFVDHGDISTDLAVQTGKLVHPSNVSTHDGDYARFLYFKDKFPESVDERADLQIGTEYINSQVQIIKDLAKETGLDLTDNQVLRLVLRNCISHEYGHAVDRALTLLNFPYTEEEDDWKKSIEVRHNIEQSVYDEIAPRDELKQLLAGQPEDGLFTSTKGTTSERIAVGFENQGFKYALEELGLDQDAIEKMEQGIRRNDRKKLEKHMRIIAQLTNSGLTIEDLSQARLDIFDYLQKKDNLEIYQPLAWGLTSRSLGYDFPLTKPELQGFISRWTPKEE